MKAHLSRRYRISASHRLHSPELSEEANRETYGKCNNPFGHGHNYTIQITVSGPVDPVTGMVADLAALDRWVQSKVIDRFDETDLNSHECFRHKVPTTENFCKAVYELLSKDFAYGRLERVRIEETANNFFEFAGDNDHGSIGNR